MSSPTSYDDDWFAELPEHLGLDHIEENMEDGPTLLQEFGENCLVDCQPENLAKADSKCSLPTAAATTPELEHQPTDYLSGPNHGTGGMRPRQGIAKTTKTPLREPGLCDHNHIMAERQRRQILSERFIALSALIPGLKKIDKSSVLGEAINYMKELKEKLKIAEEENARRADDSVAVVKRSRVTTVGNECHSSTSHTSPASCLTNVDQLPEIETRFFDTTVFIKIHCQMQTGVLTKIMNHIENLNLLVTSINCMLFNNTTLNINILAEMKPDFDMTPQEVVANLRSIF